MPIADPDVIWPKLEKLGVEEVRKKLAMGLFAPYKLLIIQEWLRRKEEEVSVIAKSTHSKNKIDTPTENLIWKEIEDEYDTSKRAFSSKINFVKDEFKRKIIYRDIAHAYYLAQNGFSKPAVILAGSIIEELLRLFLIHKKVKPSDKTFDEYIKACEDNGLLKSAIHKLSHSVRQFRNLVHLALEKSERATISKATAKGAVASIFTIANDFKYSM
jgi:hypothetical protein